MPTITKVALVLVVFIWCLAFWALSTGANC